MQPSKPKPSRILGIDYGMARIGLAISDERKVIAMPLSTFSAEKRADKTASKLLEYLNKEQADRNYLIEEIVIGLPLLLSGKSGLLADEVNHFVKILKNLTTIPIFTWDERLTSVQADRSLRESSLTRKRRSKIVDTVSATIILQNYLDGKNLRTDGQTD